MKKFLLALLFLVVAAAGVIGFFAYRSMRVEPPVTIEEEPEPESKSESESARESESEPPAAPEDDGAEAAKKAVADLLDSLKNWDEDAIDRLMADLVPDGSLPPTYKKVVRPIFESIDYTIGNAKVDGDTAVVDVAVTTVDARSALNKVLSGAVTYVAARQLMGASGTPEEHLIDYLADKIDWRNLSTIRTNTSVYLIRGGDGGWKVDASDADNLDFLNAITGGAVEVIKSLQDLAAQFQ